MMIAKKNLDASDKDFWIRYTALPESKIERQQNGYTLYNTLLTSTTASSVNLLPFPPLSAYIACI